MWYLGYTPYVEKKVSLFSILFVSYAFSYMNACFCGVYTVLVAWFSSLKHC